MRKKSAAKKEKIRKLAEAGKNADSVVSERHKSETGKKTLELDSDTESDAESSVLKINEKFADRFEHNQELSERQRLEEKYKDVDLEEESSSSEDEDDVGELITEEIEEGIQKVLRAIRENPKSLLKQDVKFFPEASEDSIGAKEKAQKPMLLKDYHRQNLLSTAETDEKPYAIQEREERAKLISQLHDEEEDGEDADDFLVKRNTQREVQAVELPDPENDGNAFLQAYTSSKAWVPKNIDPKTGKEILPSYDDLVEDDSEDDDIAEQFETAYNFRYEDPNAVDLVSYARNQSTLRRQEQNSRKRQREKKKQAQKEAEEKRKQEIKRLKKLKVNEVMKKFEKLKQSFGDDADVLDQFTENDLNAEFDGSEWDKKMQEIFNDEFYAKESGKPQFSDDGEDFEDEQKEEEDQDEEMMDADFQEEEEEEVQSDKPLSKKALKAQEKAKEKAEKQKIRDTAVKFVEENIDMVLPDEIKDAEGPKFKYRTVDPESFGLTAKDILLADDKDLNQYVGIKKLATYREKDVLAKEKKKYAKKKRLREWRKSVFDDENEPDDESVIKALSAEGRETKAKKSYKKHKKN